MRCLLKSLTITALALSRALPDASAQSTNLWPACSNATGYAVFTNAVTGNVATGTLKDARAAWCYYALEERALAAGQGALTNDFLPHWYIWEHANVVNLKAAISNLLPYYVNHTMATGGTFNAYFGAGDHTNALAFPMFSNETFCALVASSNLFTVTPWIMLDKNTSNGWDAVRAAITNLKATAAQSLLATQFVAVGIYGDPWYTGEWPAVKLATESNFQFGAATTNFSAPAVLLGVGTRGVYGFGADMENTRGLPLVSNLWAGTTFTVAHYVFPHNLTNDISEPFTYQFDANGHFAGARQPKELSGVGGSGTNGWYLSAQWYGASDPVTSSLPTWCDEPTASGEEILRGYQADLRAVLWWDFKYR